jgi:hypothetical protein
MEGPPPFHNETNLLLCGILPAAGGALVSVSPPFGLENLNGFDEPTQARVTMTESYTRPTGG